MSVVSVEERHQRRQSGTDRNGLKTHTRVWIVETDDVADGPAAAQDAAGIPGFGSTYAGVAFSGKSADPVDDDDLTFEVVVTYATGGGGEVEINPLDEPDDIEWSGSEITEPYAKDVLGADVVNSAGDPIEVERERSVGEILVGRNSATFDDSAMEDLRDTYNDAPVTLGDTTYLTGTLKMGSIRASTQYRNGVSFYRIQFPIKKDKAGWDEITLADRGFNEINAGGDRVAILDGDGSPVTTLYPLDGNGEAKADPTDPPADLTFEPYAEADWSGIFPDPA